VATRLALDWGVAPRVVPHPPGTEAQSALALETARSLGLTRPGGALVVVAHLPGALESNAVHLLRT
jgi:pyruvate kinase